MALAIHYEPNMFSFSVLQYIKDIRLWQVERFMSGSYDEKCNLNEFKKIQYFCKKDKDSVGLNQQIP